MKTLRNLLMGIVVASCFYSCGSRDYLTEEKAIEAAIAHLDTLNRKINAFNNSYPIYGITKWEGLLIFEDKAELRAKVINTRNPEGSQESLTKFHFIKTVDGQWFLEHIQVGSGTTLSDISYKIPE